MEKLYDVCLKSSKVKIQDIEILRHDRFKMLDPGSISGLRHCSSSTFKNVTCNFWEILKQEIEQVVNRIDNTLGNDIIPKEIRQMTIDDLKIIVNKEINVRYYIILYYFLFI